MGRPKLQWSVALGSIQSEMALSERVRSDEVNNCFDLLQLECVYNRVGREVVCVLYRDRCAGTM